MEGTMRIDSIHKLSDDYQEIFINNASKTYIKYEPLLLSSRTINKDPHDDIFLLEPHKFYKIIFKMYTIDGKYFDDENHIITFNFNNKFMGTSLIQPQDNFDIKEKAIYIYNAGENIIMIQKNLVIGEWHI